MENLATKYRPRTFSDVVGQDVAKQVLANSLKRGVVKPAYLVSGSYGSGKTTIARIYAMSLLCNERINDLDPCLKCVSCTSLIQGNNPNYIEIDSASNGLVADIRGLLDRLSYNPVGGSKYRIVTLDECHQLSNSAQSTLLKEIEEGLSGSIFLFCTTDPDKVLGTIKSRCIQIDLSIVDLSLMKARLAYVATSENLRVEDKALDLICKISKGHMRNALMSLDQVSLLGDITSDIVIKYFDLDLDSDYERILLNLDDPSLILKYVDLVLQRVSIKQVYNGLASRALDVYLSPLDSELKSKFGKKLLAISKKISSLVTSHPSKTELICDLILLETFISDDSDYRSLGGVLDLNPGNSRASMQKNLIKRKSRSIVSNKEKIDVVTDELISEPSRKLSGPELAQILGGTWKVSG